MTPPFYATTRARRCSARVAACIPDEVARVVTPEGDVIPVSTRLANAPVVCGLAVCTSIMSMAGDWAAAITFAYLAVQDLSSCLVSLFSFPPLRGAAFCRATIALAD